MDDSTAIVSGVRHESTRRHAAGRWITLRTRFALEMAFALAWVALSLYLAMPWIDDLDRLIDPIPSWMTIAGIAIIPGYLNAHLLAALVLDRPTPLPPPSDLHFPALTILIAAYNEAAGIADAVENVLTQDYSGELELLVIDDGSADRTAEIVATRAQFEPRLRLIRAHHGGKEAALNRGLAEAGGALIATVDADTRLAPGSLTRLASRLLIAPPDTVAAAGAVFVANPREGLLAREQDWDYFLGIASIKRQQGLLQGTLVAQGAFSVYDAHALRAAGGWPDAIGEDIVLTWAFLSDGAEVSYEPTAIAFTEAPTGLGAYIRQRRRWARGMIEGLRTYGIAILRRHRLYSHSVFVDVLFPYVDLAYCFAFLPGVVLALTGNFAIVGPMTLAVLPLNFLIAGAMYLRSRSAFRAVGLPVEPVHNMAGLVLYITTYQVLASPISVSGYALELFHAPRRW
jgi:biofilm PGA synthesis N-glycosyltransferase PgaC